MENDRSLANAVAKLRESGITIEELSDILHENLLKPKLDERVDQVIDKALEDLKKNVSELDQKCDQFAKQERVNVIASVTTRLTEKLANLGETTKERFSDLLANVAERIDDCESDTRERISECDKRTDNKIQVCNDRVDLKMQSIEWLKWIFSASIVILGLGAVGSSAFGVFKADKLSDVMQKVQTELQAAQNQNNNLGELAKRLNKTANVYHSQLLQDTLSNTDAVMARLSSHISQNDRKWFDDVLERQATTLGSMSKVFEGSQLEGPHFEEDKSLRATVEVFQQMHGGLKTLIEVIPLKDDDPNFARLSNSTEAAWNNVLRSVQLGPLSLDDESQVPRLEAYAEYALGTLFVHRFRNQRVKNHELLDNAESHFKRAEEHFPTFDRAIGMQGFVVTQRYAALTISPEYESDTEVSQSKAYGMLEDALGFFRRAATYSEDPKAKSINYNNAADALMRMADLAKQKDTSGEAVADHLKDAARIISEATLLHPAHPVVFLTYAEILACEHRLLGETWSSETENEKKNLIIFMIEKSKENKFNGFPDTKEKFRLENDHLFEFADPRYEARLYAAAGYR